MGVRALEIAHGGNGHLVLLSHSRMVSPATPLRLFSVYGKDDLLHCVSLRHECRYVSATVRQLFVTAEKGQTSKQEPHLMQRF
jgi:hypothetical protein